MVSAFKQWRVYMKGAAHPVRVFSDHKNLEYFSQVRTTSRRHARWAATLVAFNYTISYRKGASNGLLDALSRRCDYLPPPFPPSPSFPPPSPSQVRTPSYLPLTCSAPRCYFADGSPPSCHSCSPGGGCRPLCNHHAVAGGAWRGIKPRPAGGQAFRQVGGRALHHARRFALQPRPHPSPAYCCCTHPKPPAAIP